MVSFPNVKMDVHFSWLFFPFHGWYLYFYEKILGKLIGDPTFAIPYWNWDSPDGMPIPDMFANPSSPLYDKLCDDNHQPPLKIDLNYSKSNPSPVGDELIVANYRVMYTQMVSSSKTPELFFGGAYRGGESQVKAAGALENQPHTQLHIWTGDPEQKYGKDMGRLEKTWEDSFQQVEIRFSILIMQMWIECGIYGRLYVVKIKKISRILTGWIRLFFSMTKMRN